LEQSKKDELFKEYLGSSKILIVDRVSASRTRLAKMLIALGAKSLQVKVLSSIDEAKSYLDEDNPDLVLSEYKITGGSGFDLFRYFRKNNSHFKNNVLVLVTGNQSQAIVAQAAEEDVDTYILKPYTADGLRMGITDAVIDKLYPNEGKQQLFKGEYQSAIQIFEEAQKLNTIPTLALFYLGQTHYMMKMQDNAKDQYNNCLKLNSIHFKCLLGLFDLFIKQNKLYDAYEIVKRMTEYFPANLDRLTKAIRLAIMTDHIEDMEKYYNLFLELEERDDNVVNYICSGMFVLGKMYMDRGDKERGIEIFKNVLSSCNSQPKFISGMIVALSDYGLKDEMERFLSRFPEESRFSNDYLIAQFLTQFCNLASDVIAKRGLELIKNNIYAPQLFNWTLKALKENGQDNKIKEIEELASKVYPEEFPKVS